MSLSNSTLADAEQWLLCGAVVLCLLALGIIHLTTSNSDVTQHSKVQALFRFGAAAFVLVLAVAGKNLLPITLLALVAVACAIQVVFDLLSSNRFQT